jgi:predicted RNase H-like HicB family nuclease
VPYYVGILDGSKDVWGVTIPDVPGCYGGGPSPEAAIADATSALREFAAHQAAKSVALNPPRSVQDVIGDPSTDFDAAAGDAVVLIPLILDQARPVKANISLDAGLLEAIDDEAKRRGLTRSAFLTSAAVGKIVGEEDRETTVRRLRAELAATHERLARQVSHLDEMRRIRGKAVKKPSPRAIARALTAKQPKTARKGRSGSPRTRHPS